MKDGTREEVNPSLFISRIGILIYLVHTRLGIASSVSYLSIFIHRLTSKHMNASKRVLRYIKAISSFGLRYEKGKKCYTIHEYSESDFARDIDDKNSTTGQIFFLGNSAITWNIVKKNVVALSSCKAEYIVASAATFQGMWIIRFVEEILKIQVKPFKLQVDNKSTIALTQLQQTHQN